MSIRVGINGFGRIGRAVMRCARFHPEIEIAGVNDLCAADYLAYLLRHDSVHGTLDGVFESAGGGLSVNGQILPVFSEKEPFRIPWGKLGCDYVIEATGTMLTREKTAGHISAGARHVIFSAPAKDDTPVFVYGVNSAEYESSMTFVSAASCTTNCLAPLAKIVNDAFGIEKALVTTVHAYTATQKTVDGVSQKDWRGGRAAALNIIPASTGAAKAVGKVIPELAGKLTGMAMRVPVADVSALDLTAQLKTKAAYEEICAAVRRESEGKMRGVVRCSDAPLVSSDFIGERCTCVFDEQAGLDLGGGFVKLIAWYDNETGYADKLLCLIEQMHKTDAGR